MIQGKKGVLILLEKSGDPVLVSLQQVRNAIAPGIANVKPNYFWRMTSKETEFTKVTILRHDCKVVFPCVVPNDCIGLATKPNLIDTGGAGKIFLESGHEPMAEVLVEEKLHAVEPGTA